MSLTYDQLRDAPDVIRQRVAELIDERTRAAAGTPRTHQDVIAQVRSFLGEQTWDAWDALVSRSPDLTVAQVDAVALALNTTAEWLMGSDTAFRVRPSLEAQFVAGMAKHDLCEADVAEILGISRDRLEYIVASPHLVKPRLVKSLLEVLA